MAGADGAGDAARCVDVLSEGDREERDGGRRLISRGSGGAAERAATIAINTCSTCAACCSRNRESYRAAKTKLARSRA
jgi:hypothetical protein